MQQRKTSLDILRILAMWFIMTAHFFGWGGAVNILTIHDLNYYWVMPLYFASQIGNTLFFMLAGYFAKEPHVEKMLFIERKSAFYSTAITCIAFVMGEVTANYAVHAMFPLLFKKYWFVSVYLVLYGLEFLLVPGLNGLNRKHFLAVILALMFNNTLVDNAQYTLMEGLLAFIIGFYIKQYTPFSGKRKISILGRYIALMILYCVERIVVLRLGMEHSRIDQCFRYLLLLGSATVLFCFFAELNNNWKWPGMVSPYLLSVYLITANPAITTFLYEKVLHVSEMSRSVFFLPYYAISNVVLMLICVGIDKHISKINSFEVDVWIRIIRSHST